jgi:predicted DNA-binding WGR domain protein
MFKLYRLSPTKKEYWETWEDSDDNHTVHWGELGTRGTSKTVQSTRAVPATTVIQKEFDEQVAQGFAPFDPEEHATLMIEYSVDGMGSKVDVEKRHRLEDRMNEALGWTGLGACDGGSIGSGTMEVCCFVVDFELAQRVIGEDLKGTEFENFTRIYDERAE